jgi:hypothetical protein
MTGGTVCADVSEIRAVGMKRDIGLGSFEMMPLLYEEEREPSGGNARAPLQLFIANLA